MPSSAAEMKSIEDDDSVSSAVSIEDDDSVSSAVSFGDDDSVSSAVFFGDDDDNDDSFEYDGDIEINDGSECEEQHNPPSVGNSTVNDSDTEHEPNASTEELYQQCLAEIDIAWHCIPQK